ncbi:hypothetical protein NQZ79_g2338 [Umbelopsis isabellina]|nr:hypothetical protein NQZ79_g2338 [Umbelopsis isabellina]
MRLLFLLAAVCMACCLSMTKAAPNKPLARTCTASVSNHSLFVANPAGQDLLANLRGRHHHPSQAHSIRQFTIPLRSAGKPTAPEIVCTRKAWMITDTRATFQAIGDLLFDKNYADKFNNDMHAGAAGFCSVNKSDKLTARRPGVSELVAASNNARSGILDTSRLPLAIFIFAAVAMLT